jgi:hypothetical protein
MTLEEGPSVTGFSFIGKLQQLTITQTSFNPKATLKPALWEGRKYKKFPSRTISAAENTLQKKKVAVHGNN